MEPAIFFLYAFATIAALIFRETSRKGQFIEETSAETHARIHDYAWGWYGMDGSSKPRYGNWDLAINIYSVNPCKDGYMMVGGGHDRLWYRIWKTVGKDRPELEDMILDEPTLRVVIDRVGHVQQVKTCTILTDWMKDWTREECRAKLLEEEVAAGGVSIKMRSVRREIAKMKTVLREKQLAANTAAPGAGA